jgi:hypothetical protein
VTSAGCVAAGSAQLFGRPLGGGVAGEEGKRFRVAVVVAYGAALIAWALVIAWDERGTWYCRGWCGVAAGAHLWFNVVELRNCGPKSQAIGLYGAE